VSTAIQELAERESIDRPNPTYALENKITMSDEDLDKITRAIKGDS
jgi:hypothetical protein